MKKTVAVAAYDPGRRTLELTFSDGTALTIPVDIVQGLADASDADLAEIKIEAGGRGLHWPRLDADVWVPGLVQGITGTEAWMAAFGERIKPLQDELAAYPRTGLKADKAFFDSLDGLDDERKT